MVSDPIYFFEVQCAAKTEMVRETVSRLLRGTAREEP